MAFSINDILLHEISKLDNTFLPTGFKGNVREIRGMQEVLSNSVDAVGEKSSKAQGLTKTITNTDRLRASEHVLYVLKDSEANGGKGEIIGILKVGYKSLYLIDEHGKPCHVEPLCILDFYVREEYQRRGLGKKLFEYMIKDQNKILDEMAIDNPSSKLERFLLKHYNVQSLLRHNNKFAVTSKFFNVVECYKTVSGSGRTTPTSTVAGRYTARKPQSGIAQMLIGECVETCTFCVGLRYFRDTLDTAPDDLNISDLALTSPEEIAQQLKPEISQAPEIPDVPEAIESNNEEHKNHERPSTLEVRPLSRTELNSEITPAGSRSALPIDSLTDRGYFDVKYYHNKLW